MIYDVHDHKSSHIVLSTCFIWLILSEDYIKWDLELNRCPYSSWIIMHCFSHAEKWKKHSKKVALRSSKILTFQTINSLQVLKFNVCRNLLSFLFNWPEYCDSAIALCYYDSAVFKSLTINWSEFLTSIPSNVLKSSQTWVSFILIHSFITSKLMHKE